LGLRRSTDHADAAYVASIARTSELATRIDPDYDAFGGMDDLRAKEAMDRLNAQLPVQSKLNWPPDASLSQQTISKKLDKAKLEAVLTSSSTSVALKAHLNLVAMDGAGAWLHAPPVDELGTKMGAELFRVAVQRRLRMPILDRPSACPCCGSGLDIFMDHALVCQCGGDRTLRHNAIRDLVYKEAARAGLRPEKEKQGLLPPRPDAERLRGEPCQSDRRPADVWLLGWQGSPTALDFAATSGLQAAILYSSALDVSVALSGYESKKKIHLNTEEICRDSGLAFVPMVVESHGEGGEYQPRSF